MQFARVFISVVTLLAVLQLSNAASVSVSNSVSGSTSLSISNTLSPSISVSVTTSLSISTSLAPSILLPAPTQPQNSCPGQREMVCLYYTEPPGFFYPSFNIYYRITGPTSYTVIKNVQALSYTFTGAQLLASTSYDFQVTGVTFTGAESPMSPPNTFITSKPDPRDLPSAGVSNIQITAGVRTVTFSYTLGTSLVNIVHFRAHCKKSDGHPYIIRRNVRKLGTTTSKTLGGFKSGSTCQVRIRIYYMDEQPYDNAAPRKGKNMKAVSVTIL